MKRSRSAATEVHGEGQLSSISWNKSCHLLEKKQVKIVSNAKSFAQDEKRQINLLFRFYLAIRLDIRDLDKDQTTIADEQNPWHHCARS